MHFVHGSKVTKCATSFLNVNSAYSFCLTSGGVHICLLCFEWARSCQLMVGYIVVLLVTMVIYCNHLSSTLSLSMPHHHLFLLSVAGCYFIIINKLHSSYRCLVFVNYELLLVLNYNYITFIIILLTLSACRSSNQAVGFMAA